MMQTETYVCDDCGTELEVACFSELEEKKKKHKCRRVNKRVSRANEAQRNLNIERLNDAINSRIEQCRFDKLVQQGMIVCERS